MRRLAAAVSLLLIAVLVLSGLVLLSPSADARSRHFHTVLSVQHYRLGLCAGGGKVWQHAVAGHGAKRYAEVNYSLGGAGSTFYGGSYSVFPGEDKVEGGESRASVAWIKLRLHVHGTSATAHRKVPIGHVKPC